MFSVEVIVPLVFIVVSAFALVAVTRLITDYRLKRRVLDTSATPELARALAAREELGLYNALKWGIVTVGVGLAFIVVQFLPFRPDQPIIVGVILVFGGGGLLAYYLSARRFAHVVEPVDSGRQ